MKKIYVHLGKAKKRIPDYITTRNTEEEDLLFRTNKNEELVLACIDKNDQLNFLINQPGNTKCRDEKKKITLQLT